MPDRNTQPLAFVRRFLRDDRGSIHPLAFLLMATIVALGSVVAFTTVRDQLVQEAADTAMALDSLNQSYSVTIGGQVFEFQDQTDGGTLSASVTEPADEED